MQPALCLLLIYCDIPIPTGDDSGDVYPPSQGQTKRRNSTSKPRPLPVKFVPLSAADLSEVAHRVADKIYDSVNGTTCHQCRQKTLDRKTSCNASRCLGVRGQFCGPCLRNRYGEDARAAILDQDWKCPPCRGICNCSYCRRRAGVPATGILVHTARSAGYQHVNELLAMRCEVRCERLKLL